MAQDSILKNGSRFGKYTIERLLGRGGMGAVYLGRHQMLGSLFALKVLDAAMAKRSGDFVTRFIREAKLASNIRHPNLAAVHDAGLDEEQGLYYLVMDYLPGGNLRDRLSERGRLPPDEAVRIVRQIAAALVTADLHGMVHRDIKPENIMFAADGSAKLTDLGIAKGNGEQDTLVTMPAVVFGTPAYMAPEQATDASSVDRRADIWSLGVVFYEMLSGRRPYEGDGLGSVVAQLLAPDPFPDIHAVVPDVPDALAELVREMCTKDRDKRLSSPRELIARLGARDLHPMQRPVDVPGIAQVTMATQVTMSTQATVSTDIVVASATNEGSAMIMEPVIATEMPIYVEPEPDRSVAVFEAEAEARIWQRKARRRRLRIVMWMCVGVFCLVVGWYLMGVQTKKVHDGSSAGVSNVSGRMDRPDSDTNNVPGPVEQPLTNKGPEIIDLPVTNTPAVQGGGTVNKPGITPSPQPSPPPPDTIAIGIASEENVLRSALSGNVNVVHISGRPENVQRQIGKITAVRPGRIVLSLSGYATTRELSPARFEFFVRGVGKALAASGVPFAFVPGGGEYGRITRAMAQENSWDILD